MLHDFYSDGDFLGETNREIHFFDRIRVTTVLALETQLEESLPPYPPPSWLIPTLPPTHHSLPPLPLGLDFPRPTVVGQGVEYKLRMGGVGRGGRAGGKYTPSGCGVAKFGWVGELLSGSPGGYCLIG